MPSTIFITGASSGIGKTTALYFAKRGWRVAATMRHPEKEEELKKIPGIQLYSLDVTDKASVQKAFEKAIQDFGHIDVVLNNAGYAAVGPFELATEENIRQQFETNVFGVMNVTQAALPYFRKRQYGTLITVSSMGGLITFPLYSLYHGTKWAIEGFLESLHFELRPFHIKIKLIEPGAIKTDFYHRSMDVLPKAKITAYDGYFKRAFTKMQKAGENGDSPEKVAATIFKAATTKSNRLRYPVGFQAHLLLIIRRIIPNRWFLYLVRKVVES